MTKDEHLFLIDGSGYIFRAYHALPPLTRRSDGLPVGAVAGFCNMLWKLLCDARNTAVGVVPTHFAVIFDYSSKTFRKELHADYKANRTAPPEDLIPQFALIRQATAAFNLPVIEKEGFEADDIIATYAKMATARAMKTTIISSDKDLMQLVNGDVNMYDSMKDKHIERQDVFEKWGVYPEKMIELQALTGDSSDNIPGVPGIGPKTAALLLHEFGSLENLLKQAASIKQPKRRESILANQAQILLAKQLVTLDDNVALDMDIDSLRLEHQDGPKLVAFLKAMEFTTLTRRVEKATDCDANAIEAMTIEVPSASATHGPDLDDDAKTKATLPTQPSLFGAGALGQDAALGAEAKTVEAFSAHQQQLAKQQKIDPTKYETITDVATLNQFVSQARDQGFISLNVEATASDSVNADILGLSLAVSADKAAYIDFSATQDLLADHIALDKEAVIAALKPLLEDAAVRTIGHNIKASALILKRRFDIKLARMDDVMVMSYVLDAGNLSHNLEALSARWLGHMALEAPKRKAGQPLDGHQFGQYATQKADIIMRLFPLLGAALVAQKLMRVYETLDRPLIAILAKMEDLGVKIDMARLGHLSADFGQLMLGYEGDIYAQAGQQFNIGSPKQLGEILFEKLGHSGGVKTKSGQWSTSAAVLEELAANGDTFARTLMDWRQLSKLRSTYTDALPNHADSADRVHTSYMLAATTTGRLSSTEPNLQNIPIRTTEGRKIRSAFIAKPGHLLVSADYSQIELRLLAHIADIKALKQAFADDLDIHAMTASEMFQVPIKDMPAEIRRRAKAINFGIIYGISAFGLANQLQIGREEASQYIRTYFARFPGIKDYMDQTKAFAKEHGYVETIFGRRAHYSDINSANPQIRAASERAAINAPIQGSAADIIKRAMIKMGPAFSAAKLSGDMLLQVHDELVFEVKEEEVDATIGVVRTVMEEATLPLLALSVALNVDIRAAKNWDEAH